MERDGRAWDVVWDVASVGFGIHNLVKNLQSGNVDAAIDDGVGIAIDLVSAFVPFVPGGVGAVRAGVKAADVVDISTDIVNGINDIDKSRHLTPVRGETFHTKLGREKHRAYNPGEGYIKEYQLPSGKKVDAVNIEKAEVRELKPNNVRAIKRGEKQVQNYVKELQELYPDRDWKWHIDVYDKK